MNERINMNYKRFKANDKKILEAIDIKKVDKYIELLMDTKEVLWIHGDTKKKYKYEELPESSIQCLPDYSDELLEFGEYFLHLSRVAMYMVLVEGIYKEEFKYEFELGTMYSPTLAVSLIADAYHRERFVDGLFAYGVHSRLYLKLLLNLKDSYIQYKYVDTKKTI